MVGMPRNHGRRANRNRHHGGRGCVVGCGIEYSGSFHAASDEGHATNSNANPSITAVNGSGAVVLVMLEGLAAPTVAPASPWADVNSKWFSTANGNDVAYEVAPTANVSATWTATVNN